MWELLYILLIKQILIRWNCKTRSGILKIGSLEKSGCINILFRFYKIASPHIVTDIFRFFILLFGGFKQPGAPSPIIHLTGCTYYGYSATSCVHSSKKLWVDQKRYNREKQTRKQGSQQVVSPWPEVQTFLNNTGSNESQRTGIGVKMFWNFYGGNGKSWRI